jgi:dsDNA-specific endonuclease/ATPase MutS2
LKGTEKGAKGMEKDHLEVLLEDIREKFDLVLEGHDVLRKDIGNLRNEVRENKDETNFKLDALHQRVENVRGELKGEITGLREELKGDTTGLREELKGEIRGLREELKGEIRGLREELSGKIDGVANDLAAHRADTESHSKEYKVSDGK